jgi:hypothetical protein
MSWCSDAPEDEAISLFAGLLANPDMTLSLWDFLKDPPFTPVTPLNTHLSLTTGTSVRDTVMIVLEKNISCR